MRRSEWREVIPVATSDQARAEQAIPAVTSTAALGLTQTGLAAVRKRIGCPLPPHQEVLRRIHLSSLRSHLKAIAWAGSSLRVISEGVWVLEVPHHDAGGDGYRPPVRVGADPLEIGGALTWWFSCRADQAEAVPLRPCSKLTKTVLDVAALTGLVVVKGDDTVAVDAEPEPGRGEAERWGTPPGLRRRWS
jgi:hypothetical protein